MERKRGIKKLSLSVLFVAIIALTVAFASLSKSLNINGIANYSRWDIHIVDEEIVGHTEGGAQIITTPEVSENGESISDYKVTLSNAEDYVYFDFNIKNEGTVPAKLTTFELPKNGGTNSFTCTSLANPAVPEDANAICNQLEYTLKYVDGGNDVALNDELPSNTTKKVRLTLKLKDNKYNNHTATNDVQINNLGVTLTYTQKD